MPSTARTKSQTKSQTMPKSEKKGFKVLRNSRQEELVKTNSLTLLTFLILSRSRRLSRHATVNEYKHARYLHMRSR